MNEEKPAKWVSLNVGGKLFTTARTTLVDKEPNSMLARMFQSQLSPSDVDSTGAYLLDRSPMYFEPILNYLRCGKLIYDKSVNIEGILEEARFFGIDSLVNQLENELSGLSVNPDEAPLTRQEVVRALIQTSHHDELRFQGINLTNCDLRKLDLRHINFKFAKLTNANLSHANLNYCCLERADLSYTNLEGAQLMSIKALCANFEGAMLKACNFEDPNGARSNLEGVNLKGACLEDSNMAGVNLRVANLKNASLKNCNLRAAILAGADLERCNLSGSDLQEANLRGANFKDADLQLMLTPLHMSQAIR